MAEVEYVVEGQVARIALNRPAKLNALTPGMLADLEAAVRRAEADPALRVVVLHGEGRTFCVGADIDVWSALSAEEFRLAWIDNGHRAFDTVARCRLPVIAALHGMAFGGGLELALAADLRVAERGMTLALPEVSLGTVPGWGGTQRLPEIVGRPRAKQMILAAERVDAETAAAWGLVNALCAPGEALAAARGTASRIAALAPVSVQIAKRIIDSNGGAGATLELLGGMATQSTRDMQEGIEALRGKRPPVFTGT